MPFPRRRWLSLALLASALAHAAPPPPARPSLAVLLVVDQLSAANFQRRLPSSTGGFRRMAKEGFQFLDDRGESAPTMTSSGHATLATGAYPEVHGIVGNEWIDPLTHQSTYAVSDDRYPVLGEAAPPLALGPGHLKTETLGDSLKAAGLGSKVIAIAGKDRAAILLGGQSADLALWVDRRRPRFTTSRAYAQALPDWVNAVSDGLSPPGASPAEQSDALLHQPRVNQAEVDLAIAAVDHERLGQRGAPDLLMVSFSGFDEVLHAHGPDSPEGEQMFESVDQEVGRLLAALDQRPGRGHYVVALTADHGGSPTPETLKGRGLAGGRVDIQQVAAALERAASAALGKRDEWFPAFQAGGFYAAPGTTAELHRADAQLEQAARSVPGVLRLIPRDEVLRGEAGEAGRFLARGFDPERSPDYFLVLAPHFLYGTHDAAGHGTSHLYDRHVPLIWMGSGIKPGTALRAEPIDVAPTLAYLLGCEAPADSEGRILSEALARPP